MPPHAHVPGQNDRPAEGFFDFVEAHAADTTTEATYQHNIAWTYAIDLFNRGFYWETHEVLETLWMRAPQNSRERMLLQGVIHLANAALKLNMQRSVAADRLADKAIECFQEAFPAGGKETLMGLNAEELKGIASQCRPPGENISPLSIR